MPKRYSPLRYPGGKARLAPFLIEVIKSNDLDTPDYVEPYAGGAGAALHLLFEEYVETIAINDADPRIYSFWRAVIEENDRFVDELSKVNVNVSEWRRQREIYESCDLHRWFQLGFATFYLNRTTRSGIVHNGGPIGGYDQTGKYKIDARFNRDELIRRIQRIGIYSERIDISCFDGLSLLREINRSRDQATRTLVYLDPPYYHKGAELYLNRFTHQHHAALAQYLSTQKYFLWLLTYDNATEIRDMYRDCRQVRFDLSYSAYERREGEELLICPLGVVLSESAQSALPALVS